MSKKYKILTGNEAITLGAIAAGMNFFAGYPITPATEILESCSQLLPEIGGVFMQMEDELASMGAVIGASLAGAKAMTATSGPGFTLMQENLGFGTYIETPCVVVDVMRDGPSTGTGTRPLQGDIMQVKWGRAGGNHPVVAVAPASVSELYYETIRAFNLAEKLRTPVIVLSDAIMAHMSEKVQLPDASTLKIENRKVPMEPKGRMHSVYKDDGSGIPALPIYGDGRRWCVVGLTHDDSGMPVTSDPAMTQKLVTKLNAKVSNNIEEVESYEEYMTEDADIIAVSFGLLARNVKAAVDVCRAEGIKVGLLRPITLWPFPEKRLSELMDRAKHVITCEMNEGMLDGVVKQQVSGRNVTTSLLCRSDGQIIPLEDIVKEIKEAR